MEQRSSHKIVLAERVSRNVDNSDSVLAVEVVISTSPVDERENRWFAEMHVYPIAVGAQPTGSDCRRALAGKLRAIAVELDKPST